MRFGRLILSFIAAWGVMALVGVGIILFFGNCVGGDKTIPQEPEPSPSPAVFTGTTQEKILSIADYVTKSAVGLLVVSYAEAPPHFRESGEVHYGVHYNVFVTKRADLLAPTDTTRVMRFVGELFRLTTLNVLAGEPTFSHIGVQLFDANAWFYGGHERGAVRMYIANKADLVSIDDDAFPVVWLQAASEDREVIVTVAMLRSLLDELDKAKNQK